MEKLDDIKEIQKNSLEINNRGREVKTYSAGEKVFISRNTRQINKFD